MESLQALFKMGENNEYEKLNGEEDTIKPVTSIDAEVPRPHRRSSSASQQKPIETIGCMWILQAVFFIFSSIMLLLAYITRSPVHEGCLKQEYIHTPVLDIVDERYRTLEFNGTFNAPSPYKGPPSPEVDAAWKEIVEVSVISISEDTLNRIGGSKDSVKLPPEIGGGYMGALEVFHQLHCLNLLWQGTYADYYDGKVPAWEDSPHTLREHLDHCADLLRQKLMCDTDVTVYTFDWVRNHSHPFPNVNSKHKCRNFDDVLAWSKAHRVPKPKGGWIVRPEDAVVLPFPP